MRWVEGDKRLRRIKTDNELEEHELLIKSNIHMTLSPLAAYQIKQREHRYSTS